MARDAEAVATTPTRNRLTAEIPPFMLETPPHAPFLTTPLPPSNNPAATTVPEAHAPRRQQGRNQQTPTANGNGTAQNETAEQRRSSQHALAATSETGQEDEQSFLDSIHHDVEDAKQLRGLRDICSLATWTLSSAKPGCALPELRHPSPSSFWQSDGPQPHTLTLHFFKLVAIVKMRIYLDFELDESYTPTKMKFYAGMSEGSLVEFGTWEVTETVDPETGETHSNIEGLRGWLDVPLKGVGGRETRYYGNSDVLDDHGEPTLYPLRPDVDNTVGGDVLKAMVVQVRICENHQNGKDTHVRGFQVFSRDYANYGELRTAKKSRHSTKPGAGDIDHQGGSEVVGLMPADWMGEAEIR
jgi:anaphase-promoting complex subunit 10